MNPKVLKALQNDYIRVAAHASKEQPTIDFPDWRFRATAKHIALKGNLLGLGRLQFPATMFPVEVRPSPVHGMGVFVTCDVEANQVLTLYPNDAHVSWRGAISNEGIPVVVDCHMYVWDATESREPADVVTIHQEYGICIDFHDGIVLQGVGYPELNDDPAYLGHLCNDAAGKVSKLKYEKKTRKHANAGVTKVHSGLHRCVVSTRPIPKGSEVLVCYGPGYWETQAQM